MEDALARVDRLLDRLGTTLRKGGLKPADISDLQVGLLHHPDAGTRRSCLMVLDHHANDTSVPTFAQALGDPEAFVRDVALHSIACEVCKVGEVEADTVVPPLVALLEHDPRPDLRIKAARSLFFLQGRDERATTALRAAEAGDPDALVRGYVGDALAGRPLETPRKRYDRRQKRNRPL